MTVAVTPLRARAVVRPPLRERVLARLRRHVERGAPRSFAAVLVALTALAGLGCSWLLLRLGLGGLGLRWALSVVAAYATFVLLLGAWAIWKRRRLRELDVDPDVLDEVDPGDVVDALTSADRRPGSSPLDGASWPGGGSGTGGARPGTWAPGGGRFSGGGASGRLPPMRAAQAADAGDAADGLGGSLDAADLLDHDSWPLLAAAVVAAVALSALAAAAWVVYTAPALLAELLLDAAVAGGLWRRLARAGAMQPWWNGAVRRTWVPALVVVTVFGCGGLLLESAVPGATTLGQVVAALRAAW